MELSHIAVVTYAPLFYSQFIYFLNIIDLLQLLYHFNYFLSITLIYFLRKFHLVQEFLYQTLSEQWIRGVSYRHNQTKSKVKSANKDTSS